MKSIIALLFIFFSASVFSQDIDALKKKLDTLQTLFTNETLTSDQYSEAVEKLLAEELEEYASLKKMLDDGILDQSQFWGAINKILGYDQGETSSSTSTDETVNSNEESEEKTVSNENSTSNSDDEPSKNEKELLSDAIGSIQSINPDVATKDRLTLYENAIDNVAKIEKFYAGTDTALKLKTNQNIGDFSITKIRQDYLNEVLGFYDIVCEKSPSYLCLGFVSLKTGKEMCESGSGLDELKLAHDSLLNAVKIFKGQESKSAYSNIALASHRNCSKTIPGVDIEWSKGYFAMPLVQTLLDLGEEQTTRGIIENLNDPYFKLLSVLYLKKISGDEPDISYRDRIKQFIDQKIERGTLSNTLSRLALTKLMLNYSSSNFVADDASYASDYDAKLGVKLECGGFVMNYLHEEYLDLINDLYLMDKNRWDGGWGYQFPSITKNIPTSSNVFSHCGQGDWNTPYNSRYYYASFRLFTDLLIYNGIEDASKFKEFTLNDASGNQNKLFDFYVDLRLSDNKIETVLAPYDDIDPNDLGFGVSTWHNEYSEREGSDLKLERISGVYNFEEFSKLVYLERLVFSSEGRFVLSNQFSFDSSAIYKVFQANVDYGEVCKSSELLFQVLDTTNYYQEAIDYMVSSPAIDPNTKYKCGDEDLELLLN